jgi:hypothetical protein
MPRGRIPAKRITVQGERIESATVGVMVFVRTTAGLYMSHEDWIPPLDEVGALRLRALWASGEYRMGELGRMFGIHESVVVKACMGRGAFAGLTPIRWQPRDHRTIRARRRRAEASRASRAETAPA